MLLMKETTFTLCDIVSIYKFVRRMIYRMIFILFNGRRRIAIVLGVCLVLTITFILKSINYDISLTSRHVITFQANITHSDNTYGVHRTKALDRTPGRDCNFTTQNGVVKKNIYSIIRTSKQQETLTAPKATSKPMKHHSINALKYIKNHNKSNNGFYSKEILQQQQQHPIETPLQNPSYDSFGINILKQNRVLAQKEMVAHDLQQPKLFKSFTRKETELLHTKHLDEAKENKLTSKLKFQRQFPEIAGRVRQSKKVFSNELLNNNLFYRLQEIQDINMQNQEALAHNGLILRDQLINKDLGMPEPLSFDTFTEKKQIGVSSKQTRTNEVRYMRGQTHGLHTNADGVDSSERVRQIKAHSRSVQQPVQASRDKTKAVYHCENPREVPKVENILCMDRPKFLPNYKNPCWRDSITGALRCLPYFHIFGTCKSGTTDLFHRMVHHPQILPNKGVLSKETWFWSWKRYDRMIGVRHNQTIPDQAMTLRNFTDFFDAKMIESFMTNVDGHSPYHQLVTGHGDPMDIWDFTRWRKISQNNPMTQEPEVTTPNLVRHVNPDVKLIALLREPAERTYSHYLHIHLGDNKESFHFHVVQTIKYLRDCESNGRLRACVYKHGLRMKAPLHASLYYLHLTEWLKVFPRNQILLLTNDDYQQDTAGTLSTVFRYLNLDPMPYSDLVKVASRQRQYVSPLKAKLGAMLPQTKAILGEYFEDSIHKLVSLLNDTKYLKWIDNSSLNYDAYSTNPIFLNKSNESHKLFSGDNLSKRS
ncbi:Carbohydrate sulfotransferase 15 [Mizuhopecten yessoensis]|uniref:Carbohydrate sulfotransferase 15 n=1 Tax=Mizuhopecten yessoensis TaxID=6573 RepID=A0A210R2E5_MIZYE|nr:Carbohydrate sulfotransferase 15 [Mizuhopecten yessoensis]